MLKNIRIIIATITLSLALFSFFANFTILLSYVFILLSIMCILFGIDEIKQQQKTKAFIYFLCSAFVLYVGVSNIFS
ncbi:YczI family protein [Bacillus cereus]|uniref:YczI family protein n=1 Tax=Bacillus cereus TaxID=1396 RepID=UPI001E43BED7|nr:YczI family protein [Bacillus cereus]